MLKSKPQLTYFCSTPTKTNKNAEKFRSFKKLVSVKYIHSEMTQKHIDIVY